MRKSRLYQRNLPPNKEISTRAKAPLSCGPAPPELGAEALPEAGAGSAPEKGNDHGDWLEASCAAAAAAAAVRESKIEESRIEE